MLYLCINIDWAHLVMMPLRITRSVSGRLTKFLTLMQSPKIGGKAGLWQGMLDFSLVRIDLEGRVKWSLTISRLYSEFRGSSRMMNSWLVSGWVPELLSNRVTVKHHNFQMIGVFSWNRLIFPGTITMTWVVYSSSNVKWRNDPEICYIYVISTATLSWSIAVVNSHCQLPSTELVQGPWSCGIFIYWLWGWIL